jgi:hypothetical protein
MVCRAAFGAVLLISSAAWAAPATKITQVKISHSGGSFGVAIAGRHFGASPVSLPCNACTAPELKFFDNAKFRSIEAPNILTWTDSSITLSGVTGAAGDSISLVITNDALHSIATSGGNFPGKHPSIKSVVFSGSGQNLQMVIAGSGFGSAPQGVPGNTVIPYFQFLDWKAINSFSAGYTGQGYTDTVTLNYVSWSDTQIVIHGFGGQYGQNGYTVTPGDPFIITQFTPPGIIPGQTGPQTSKGGRLP